MLYKFSDTIYVLGKTIIKPEKSFSINSYLIKRDKNILIDGVAARAGKKFLETLESVIPIKSLDALLLNHSEEDHSGYLPDLLSLNPNIPIYCSNNCVKNLFEKLSTANFNIVKNNEKIQFGDLCFTFIYTPGLHLNDNMVTYYENEKILFSNDLFGQYLGSEIPLDSEFSSTKLMEKAEEYLIKIFSDSTSEQRKVINLIDNLDIDCIAPGHGLILKNKKADVLSLYKKWAQI